MARTFTPTQFPDEVTTYDVDLPATVDAGDRLILILGIPRSYGGLVSGPSGWTQREAVDTSFRALLIYERIADGTEGGGTATFVTNNARRGAAMVIREDAAHASQDIETATVTVSPTSSFDPPSLTASWGAESTNIWLTGAVTTADDADTTITAYPANYGAGSTEVVQSRDVEDAGDDCTLFIAERVANVATEDPGSFSIDNNEGSVAFTIALRGAAASSAPNAPAAALEGSGTDGSDTYIDVYPSDAYSDPDSHPFDFTRIQYSLDDGSTWTTAASPTTRPTSGSPYRLSTADIGAAEPGDSVRVRMADADNTDGLGSYGTVLETFFPLEAPGSGGGAGGGGGSYLPYIHGHNRGLNRGLGIGL